MNLSIQAAGVAAWPASDAGASLAQAANAAAQADPSSAAHAASPLIVSAVDPNDHSRLDRYLSALGAPLKMGGDAEQMAEALVPAMQSLLQQRPDLGNAHFDFALSRGSLVVKSDTLDDADRAWLQDFLNGNKELLQAAQAFHDDAVAGYASWAEADGKPLSAAQLDAVSQQADGLVSFMDLFKKLGRQAHATLLAQVSYMQPDGSRLDLSRDPGSANGFLAFMQGAHTMRDGTATYAGPAGQTVYGGLRGDIFSMIGTAIPQFLPPSASRSVGLKETA
ncbi:hypothetical protein [Cupriavidus malaysiensis]|uniref:Uncharacterized protein n=1 Tax=Cupriavidus malaysiensis TaxID=367825 RepID=A0ABM6F492_9BURK|nr:hypothetical protein [Cupriavidus malaysiensis]AOZ06261.1 hypothetical protein BKK80_10755 [Cupriavidus malaysiensis]